MQIKPTSILPMLGMLLAAGAHADVFNLKVVTDASPDYSDMESMVHSVSSKWHWNHIARRQTNPMQLHGFALTDPIRQFNDYGFTMCSTISGINCAIWDAMGFKTRYWDVTLHTVPEVEYGGRWHIEVPQLFLRLGSWPSLRPELASRRGVHAALRKFR
jgi:hypothetical protein